jgi:hypothetical protein
MGYSSVLNLNLNRNLVSPLPGYRRFFSMPLCLRGEEQGEKGRLTAKERKEHKRKTIFSHKEAQKAQKRFLRIRSGL